MKYIKIDQNTNNNQTGSKLNAHYRETDDLGYKVDIDDLKKVPKTKDKYYCCNVTVHVFETDS